MKNFLSWLRRNGATIGVATAIAATVSPSLRDAALAVNAAVTALAQQENE